MPDCGSEENQLGIFNTRSQNLSTRYHQEWMRVLLEPGDREVRLSKETDKANACKERRALWIKRCVSLGTGDPEERSRWRASGQGEKSQRGRSDSTGAGLDPTGTPTHTRPEGGHEAHFLPWETCPELVVGPLDFLKIWLDQNQTMKSITKCHKSNHSWFSHETEREWLLWPLFSLAKEVKIGDEQLWQEVTMTWSLAHLPRLSLYLILSPIQCSAHLLLPKHAMPFGASSSLCRLGPWLPALPAPLL